MASANSAFDALQSEGQAELLDDIDRLRSQGISSYGGIPLPQLIVCGDQSSGKSSVLEAISQVSFPTNDGTCTRFATEVVLRKSREASAAVTIQPGKSCSSEQRQKLQAFHKSHCKIDEIPGFIQEAKVVMGLSDESGSFSDDILKLEISGPNQPHLTLVDLPGLIHTPNKLQTQSDVALVKELVKAYMRNRRSIILAVISAKNDIQNQIVLQMAKEIDKDMTRTMGIITKPDTVQAGSASELAFLALARNEDISFRLGWHVLRNPDFSHRRDRYFDRDSLEKVFFAEAVPWNTLPPAWTGIFSLRYRLSSVLMEQIGAELPEVIREIEEGIEVCRCKIKRLGSPRESSKDQRDFLIRLSGKVHDTTKEAVDGQYRDSFFDVGDVNMQKQKRLRSVVRDWLDQFAEDMTKRGHYQEIVEAPTSALYPSKASLDPMSLPSRISKDVYLARLRPMIKDSRGRELSGTFNPLLIGPVFKQQSVKWEQIAELYGRRLWKACTLFFESLIRHAALSSTAEAILRNIISPALESRQALLKVKIDELLSPYRKGYPLTLNRTFIKDSQDLNNSPSKTLRSEDDLLNHACSELLTGMQAYYKVALDVFVDNFATLAIENCLLEGLEELLSPLSVAKMTDEELNRLAAESPDIRAQRSQATTKLKVLENGLESCKRHARRRPTFGETTSVQPDGPFSKPTSGEPTLDFSSRHAENSDGKDPNPHTLGGTENGSGNKPSSRPVRDATHASESTKMKPTPDPADNEFRGASFGAASWSNPPSWPSFPQTNTSDKTSGTNFVNYPSTDTDRLFTGTFSQGSGSAAAFGKKK